MIDLHMHTLFSDGALLPSELARRAEARGYRAMAITDHVDATTVEHAVKGAATAARELAGKLGVAVIAGAEVTHVPPVDMADMIGRAREAGAAIVLVHGETLAEPVAPGTNRAAILGGADILAHPGLISEEDAALAAERGVALEITARKGHCITNGHVAAMALRHGARLVVNTDTHEPGDLVTRAYAMAVLLGAGLGQEDAARAMLESEAIAKKALGRDI